jgi:hypothetical protein
MCPSNIIGIRNNNTIIPYTPGSNMPAGTIIAYTGSIAGFASTTSDGTTLVHKDGWAVCNGASISQTTYAELFARLSTTWNTATNPLTGSAQAAPSSGFFRVPNLQGTFLRGVGDFSDNTKDTALAGFQTSQNLSHNHSLDAPTASGVSMNRITRPGVNGDGTDWIARATGHDGTNYSTVAWDTTSSDSGATESRPQNVGVYYLVKLYDNQAPVDVYIAPASPSISGLVSTEAQTFAGRKSAGNTKISAYVSANQSIATATEVRVAFDTLHSGFTNTETQLDITTNKGRFTATRAGYYLVTVGTEMDVAHGLYILKDGLEVARDKIGASTVCALSGLFYLAVGSYIECKVYQTSGTRTLYGSNNGAKLSIVELL